MEPRNVKKKSLNGIHESKSKIHHQTLDNQSCRKHFASPSSSNSFSAKKGEGNVATTPHTHREAVRNLSFLGFPFEILH